MTKKFKCPYLDLAERSLKTMPGWNQISKEEQDRLLNRYVDTAKHLNKLDRINIAYTKETVSRIKSKLIGFDNEKK